MPRGPGVGDLACPQCFGALAPLARGLGGLHQVLCCVRCGVRVPVAFGFPLFTERELDDGSDPGEWVRGIAARFFRSTRAYREFGEAKARRGLIDIYAAFQPFNESCRTLGALMTQLRRHLRPGDLIVDLWNRTGWTGELLAGLFPEQRVVSFWEGNHDTLGYDGYRRWLPEGRRAPNLTIVFQDPREALPFREESVAFVHGYDCLHRRRLVTLRPDLVRITRSDAWIVFPHVHLTNGEPDPWFDRGGILRSGLEYRRVWSGPRVGVARRAFVLGERSLFEAQCQGVTRPLEDEAETSDYNAMVVVGPASAAGAPIDAVPGFDVEVAKAAVLVSPLLQVSAVDGSVRVVDSPGPDGKSTLLGRHPVYRELLAARAPARLDPLSRQLVYWAERLPTAAAIFRRVGGDEAQLTAALRELQRQEIVCLAPVSPACATLQRYHATILEAPPADDDDPDREWCQAALDSAERPFLVDDASGDVITYGEAGQMVDAAAHALRRQGIGPGSVVVLAAPLHVESILLFWALMRCRAVVSVVDHEGPSAIRRERLRRLGAALLVTDALDGAPEGEGPRVPVLLLDGAGAEEPSGGEDGVLRFSTWLTEADFEAGAAPSLPFRPEEPAVILWSSGTTGGAKGIMLSGGALCHSGRLVARELGLRKDDVHLPFGDLHTMTGLRNPCLAVVHARASNVIASADTRSRTLLQCAAIDKHGVTVISAVPAALRQLTAVADRLGPSPLPTLRAVVSAGATLGANVRAEFQARFGARVHDAYGLTETAGFCIASSGDDAPEGPGDVGRPVDALLRVVDDAGRDVAPGEEGELLIHSQNLMLGYHRDAEGTRAAFLDGWLRTGDLARISPNGHCLLRGRRRDRIKNIHAEIVSAREVEEALLSLAEVADAVVLPYRDDNGHDHFAALIVPAGQGADRRERLGDIERAALRRLGPKRMPGRFVQCDELPRGASGKVSQAAFEELLSHA